VFCSALVQSASADGLLAFKEHRTKLEELKKDDGKMIKDAKAAAEKAAADAKAKEDAAASQIESLTKAKEEAEKKFADAPVGKREAEAKAVTDAKDALKKAEEPVTKAKDEAAVKEEAFKKLEADLAALQALADKQDAGGAGSTTQLFIQIKAALFSVVFAFLVSLALCALTQAITMGNFRTDARGESEGLDRTEHDEVGFDFSAATESVAVVSAEPRAALAPKGNGRFDVQVTGATGVELMKVWTELCQPRPEEAPADADFLAVYPYVTTVKGTTFHFRGGNSEEVAKRLASLFTKHLGKDIKAVKV
jgi:hypothetical protein